MELVKFGALWCGPCRREDEELEKISSDIKVTYIDVDEDPDLANAFKVKTIPAILLMDNTYNEMHRWVGFTSAKDIMDYIQCIQTNN